MSDSLGELLAASPEDRKWAFRELRDLVNGKSAAFELFVPTITLFLTDDERAVRLLTAKVPAAVAGADSDMVASVVSAFVERLADEDEFYYVRVRLAEALGCVTLDRPDAVISPAILADLRISLSFGELEVKQKLAKTLERVALGGLGRLRHRVSAFVKRLNDRDELVRYHLCAAIASVGCDSPNSLAVIRGALSARLVDESALVRDHTAETFGLLTDERGDHRGHDESVAVPNPALGTESDRAAVFVAGRVGLLRASIEGDTATAVSAVEGVGTLAGIQRTTADAIAEVTSLDVEGVCPHCGIDLVEDAPSMCSSCDTPY